LVPILGGLFARGISSPGRMLSVLGGIIMIVTVVFWAIFMSKQS
jgi:hypothetical protein